MTERKVPGIFTEIFVTLTSLLITSQLHGKTE